MKFGGYLIQGSLQPGSADQALCEGPLFSETSHHTRNLHSLEGPQSGPVFAETAESKLCRKCTELKIYFRMWA